MELAEYVINHTDRGECQCGECIDKGNRPDPTGHTADLIFFKVAATNNPSAEEFIQKTKSHQGTFCEVDPFDGAEHGYMELGGWIGDQGLAMQYMGLGALLGVFDLITPKTVFGNDLEPDLVHKMAGAGLISVFSKPTPNCNTELQNSQN